MTPQTIYPVHRVLAYYASRRNLQRLLRPRRLPTTSLQPTKNAELFAIHGGRLLRCRDLHGSATRDHISEDAVFCDAATGRNDARTSSTSSQGLQAHQARRWTATRTAEIALGATKTARDRASGRTATGWANKLTQGPLRGSSQAMDRDEDQAQPQ